MAENEQSHRHRIEDNTIELAKQRQERLVIANKNDYLFARYGQWFMFTIVILYFIIIVILGYFGMEKAVCTALGASVIFILCKYFILPISKKGEPK